MSDEQPKRTCPQCEKDLPEDAPEDLCPACLLKAGAASGTSPSQATTGDAAEPPVSNSEDSEKKSFVPPTIEELKPHFPQLELLELLGQGGMGAVYRARQTHLDRIVALKVLPCELGQDAAFAERFAREARALARLSHPNVINVYDYGKAGDHFFILMEYVDGANLREIQRTGRLSPEQALKIVPELCEALQYAHEEGVVHRDVKPENILFDRTGRVKIADFGLAKLASGKAKATALTGSNQVVGTWQYMAPEQVEHSREVDHRADIYSLGVVLYEMLTGELPLGRFEPPSRKIQVDVRLDEVVLKTLEKDPARRYQQAEDVKTDVEEITEKTSTGTSSESTREEPSSKGKERVTIDREGFKVVDDGGTHVSVRWDGVHVNRGALRDKCEREEESPKRKRHKMAFYGVGLIIEGVALVVYVLALLGRGLSWSAMPYSASMLLAGPAIVFGGTLMLTLRSLGWSYTAAILALVAIPFWYDQTAWYIWIPIMLFNISAISELGGRNAERAFEEERAREGGVGLGWVAALLLMLAAVLGFAYSLHAPRGSIATQAESVRERVVRLTVEVRRLKDHPRMIGMGSSETEALGEAGTCADDLYALAQGKEVQTAAEEGRVVAPSSRAQRARNTLHRLQLALGQLEYRTKAFENNSHYEELGRGLAQLQREVTELSKSAQAIGAIETVDFDRLQKRIRDEIDVLKRVEIVKDAVQAHLFTMRQAESLVSHFENTGSSQARVVEMLLPRVTDSEEAARLLSPLVEADRERIRTAWEGRHERAKREAAFKDLLASGQNALNGKKPQEVEEQYQSLLQTGREALVRKDIQAAKAAFLQAREVKPTSDEVVRMLAETEKLLHDSKR